MPVAKAPSPPNTPAATRNSAPRGAQTRVTGDVSQSTSQTPARSQAATGTSVRAGWSGWPSHVPCSSDLKRRGGRRFEPISTLMPACSGSLIRSVSGGFAVVEGVEVSVVVFGVVESAMRTAPFTYLIQTLRTLRGGRHAGILLPYCTVAETDCLQLQSTLHTKTEWKDELGALWPVPSGDDGIRSWHETQSLVHSHHDAKQNLPKITSGAPQDAREAMRELAGGAPVVAAWPGWPPRPVGGPVVRAGRLWWGRR